MKSRMSIASDTFARELQEQPTGPAQVRKLGRFAEAVGADMGTAVCAHVNRRGR